MIRKRKMPLEAQESVASHEVKVRKKTIQQCGACRRDFGLDKLFKRSSTEAVGYCAKCWEQYYGIPPNVRPSSLLPPFSAVTKKPNWLQVFRIKLDVKTRSVDSAGFSADCHHFVTDVQDGSPASVAGIVPGMKVVQVNSSNVAPTSSLFERIAREHTSNESFTVTVEVNSHHWVTGVVDDWNDTKQVGYLIPDSPVFIQSGVWGSKTIMVYTGRVTCTRDNLKKRSLHVGMRVSFSILIGKDRLYACSVTPVKIPTKPTIKPPPMPVATTATKTRTCMMHTVGCCSDADCDKGEHVSLPDPPENPFVEVNKTKLIMLGEQVKETGCTAEVMQAWEIRNPFLEARHRLTVDNFTLQYEKTPDMIQGFHGTSPQNIIHIAQRGFDPSRRNGQAYGKGEYFARDPWVAINYGRGTGYVFMCNLVLGKNNVDNIYAKAPGYYVICQSQGSLQALPQYLVKLNNTDALQTGRLWQRSSPEAVEELQETLEETPKDDAEATLTQTLKKLGKQQRGGMVPCLGRVNGAMQAEMTKYLFVGWMDPDVHCDPVAVKKDLKPFLKPFKIKEVLPERNGSRLGAYVQLKRHINKFQFAALNCRLYRGKYRISVDDAQPSNPWATLKPCPRVMGPGKYCRGENLKGHYHWANECSFKHEIRSTYTPFEEGYTFEDIGRDEAKFSELSYEVEQERVGYNTSMSRVVNKNLEAAYDMRRSFLEAKHTKIVEKELWYGVSAEELHDVLLNGLRCPADYIAAKSCPVSGHLAGAPSLCNKHCEYCVEKHEHQDNCHLYGMGIYLSDWTVKAARSNTAYLIRYRANLGNPYVISGNLLDSNALRCNTACTDPTPHLDWVDAKWDKVKGHDSYYVQGLGEHLKQGHGVKYNEYVVFHPHQLLPLYVVSYTPHTGGES